MDVGSRSLLTHTHTHACRPRRLASSNPTLGSLRCRTFRGWRCNLPPSPCVTVFGGWVTAVTGGSHCFTRLLPGNGVNYQTCLREVPCSDKPFIATSAFLSCGLCLELLVAGPKLRSSPEGFGAAPMFWYGSSQHHLRLKRPDAQLTGFGWGVKVGLEHFRKSIMSLTSGFVRS